MPYLSEKVCLRTTVWLGRTSFKGQWHFHREKELYWPQPPEQTSSSSTAKTNLHTLCSRHQSLQLLTAERHPALSLCFRSCAPLAALARAR